MHFMGSPSFDSAMVTVPASASAASSSDFSGRVGIPGVRHNVSLKKFIIFMN